MDELRQERPSQSHPPVGDHASGDTKAPFGPPEDSMRRRTLVIRNHGYLKRGTGARFLTVDLERKTGITGVPFGRTEVSIPFV